jgi:deoxyadenosine/deoxycytidine kinase
MENLSYIAIDGPIGVGKTSLAELLAKEFNGTTLIEEVDTNPFLPKFYEDIRKYSFQTQLFFLISRFQQQKDMFQQELFSSTIVADYLFAKDRIFAYLNLSEDELGLYEQVYRLLDTRIPRPDLVLYLQASTDTLLERIKKRNKSFEKSIGEDYLEKLVEAYNRYFFYYSDTPLLIIDTTDIDFVNDPADLTNLVREIRSMKGGSQHYIPVASAR